MAETLKEKIDAIEASRKKRTQLQTDISEKSKPTERKYESGSLTGLGKLSSSFGVLGKPVSLTSIKKK